MTLCRPTNCPSLGQPLSPLPLAGRMQSSLWSACLHPQPPVCFPHSSQMLSESLLRAPPHWEVRANIRRVQKPSLDTSASFGPFLLSFSPRLLCSPGLLAVPPTLQPATTFRSLHWLYPLPGFSCPRELHGSCLPSWEVSFWERSPSHPQTPPHPQARHPI